MILPRNEWIWECLNCHQQFPEVKIHNFKCPNCGGGNWKSIKMTKESPKDES